MGSIVLYTHANIWEDPYSRFGIKSKEVKKNTFFGHLITYNPVLRIFQKYNLAQTMDPSVLYTRAEDWKYS